MRALPGRRDADARPRYDATRLGVFTARLWVRGDCDRVHLAGHAGIVNRDAGLDSRGDGVYDASFITLSVSGRIKTGTPPRKHEGVGGETKVYDGSDFVPLLYVQKQRHHFQRRGGE